jgi:hypothetical protein
MLSPLLAVCCLCGLLSSSKNAGGSVLEKP